MLFFIFIALLVVGIFWFWYCSNEYDFNLPALVLLVTSACCVIISITIICCNYIGVDGFIEKSNIRYEMLVYQYENNFYDNDNDIGKRELIKDIQDWNEDLAYFKEIQDDFWIGIYEPNIFDQFDFIKLE